MATNNYSRQNSAGIILRAQEKNYIFPTAITVTSASRLQLSTVDSNTQGR